MTDNYYSHLKTAHDWDEAYRNIHSPTRPIKPEARVRRTDYGEREKLPT